MDKNIKKEFITLQLEDILAPKKIETQDSKMKNITILSVAQSKMQIVDEFLIEGLQKLQQYTKVNPISVQIIDTSLTNKLAFYSRNYKYKYRFTANSLLFSSTIKENTNAIFMGSMTLKHQVINGKVFQGIGTIYTSETVNWDKIKTKSHWTNVTLTASTIPIAAKHFAFETRDSNNLFNFEYSLLHNKGELLEFAEGEDKIPALNFTIQIVH